MNKLAYFKLIHQKIYNSFTVFGNLGTKPNESILAKMKKHGIVFLKSPKVSFSIVS